MASVFNDLETIKRALERPRFGLMTDVDGTISPTAPTPAQAAVSPANRRYLARLTPRLALAAAVSGRAVADVRRLVGIDGVVYVGNHGLEHWAGGRAELARGAEGYPAIIQEVTDELGRELQEAGIIIENKGVSASIHYRLSPDPDATGKRVMAAINASAQAGRLRIIPGRRAVNLLPPLAIDKGTAVRDLIARYNLSGGVYIGDETTDIDAFKAIHEANRRRDFLGFALAVLSREAPPAVVEEADFTLDGTDEVARFLEWLWRQVSK
ncbi:MAG: trehalose-phosphatase [Dehalococcoidales bacterium]